jgi:hypothetical protein
VGEALNYGVEAKRIHIEEWQIHWPLIDRELDTIPQYWEDYWTKDFIRNQVVSGDWQAWGFGDIGLIRVIVLTQIIVYPANTFLQILLAFGNSLEKCLPHMEATFERFANENNCDGVEIINARVGWERKLKRFKRTGLVLKSWVPKLGVH